ncbi:hypothetical protein ABZ806_13835 [Spirillospora sp. NPDC047418]|jgi:hypothetical protein
MGSDLLDGMAECVGDGGEFLALEPGAVGFQIAISKRAKPHGQ